MPLPARFVFASNGAWGHLAAASARVQRATPIAGQTLKFSGWLIYKDEPTDIVEPEDAATEFIKRDVGDMVKRLAGKEPCQKVPLFRECDRCPITDADCGDRVKAEQQPEQSTTRLGIGALIRLRSGGIKMTVLDDTLPGGLLCGWQDQDGNPRCHQYPEAALAEFAEIWDDEYQCMRWVPVMDE